MNEKFEKYLAEFKNALETSEVTGVKEEKLSLAEGVETAGRLIEAAAARGKKIMLIGNGGSAAIAGHLAVDFWKNAGIRALAFNDASLLTCIGNDYSFEQIFAKPVEMFADEGDVLIAISSSGKSANILNGAKAARQQKCTIITLSGFRPDNPLRAIGDINFYVSAQDYGPVENAHHFICHCIYDIILNEKRGK